MLTFVIEGVNISKLSKNEAKIWIKELSRWPF